MQDNTMPQAVAKANYVRIAPRKVQIVLDLSAISRQTKRWQFSNTRPRLRVNRFLNF